MAKKNQLSESLEDYLETILELQKTKTVARSKDIAEKMDIKRGSVTGMLKKLAGKELINYEPYGYVTLTPEGKKIALEIERRHIFLKDFFYRVLKVDEKTADRTACQMEHAMNQQTFNKFKKFINKIDTCPHNDINPNSD
ncbi:MULTISPECIES: metal-dependent transcriptional regulator [Desulfobacula]|uniref:Transcriptional regulator MntR n=2 Tax=Desulfobacula TaxID=28222 RepID=K0NKY5_DESTT|nr:MULTISPECIES: metal-dependent transcriptional regulator [Desulfobacula]CCK81440.1 predicted iron-dependent repressor, DtxR family [Desulfobacula toluolica Tol2]SDU29100.1 iron (metal) dependent repressor, DtxR family [Desulfobacula phenolica]